MAAELVVTAVLLVVVDSGLITEAETSWRSNGVWERSEVVVGRVKYWLLAEVLLLVVIVVATGTGELRLVAMATSSPPAAYRKDYRNIIQ